MRNTAGIIFLVLFSFAFLSCHSKAGTQNKTVPQEADISVEQSKGTAIAENSENEALLQASAETVHIDMTLIQAVEPELLRNVMPSSWRKLSRLTEAEEQAFIRENAAALARVAETMRNKDLGWNWIISRFEYYSVYRQRVGTDTFHRVLVMAENTPDFLSPGIRFVQFLVYEGTLLPLRDFSYIIAGSYNAIGPTQHFDLMFFQSIDIIPGKERAKGILQTMVEVQTDDPNDWSGTAQRLKGQICGRTKSEYYLMDDLLNGNLSSIEINASDCLVDPIIPLRYSLQNAFDGDPSTSYVTNADGELMNIQFYIDRNIIQRYAVINGYAQNMVLYKNNNRIKTIGINGLAVLNDDTLGYQMFDSIYQSFSVADIYKGDKYNDTCLAEINVYTTKYGWLFGDMDE
jgi:sporulation protein YlmC with PRC-barrel domain